MSNKKGHPRPNVLYIIAHDQGIAAACYTGAGPDASASLPTPNIDTLASQGVIFTNHFATAPLCSPARGSLLTGVYPHQNGLVGLVHRGFSLNEGQQTVIHAFHDAGYHTVLLGMQHESKNPLSLGYEDVRATTLISPCVNLTEDVHDTLRELRDSGQSWWFTIGTEEVHRKWKPKAPPVDPQTVQVPAYLPDTPEVRSEVAEFVGVVKAFDAFVGLILGYLDELAIRESTLVVLTTDHGVAWPRAKGTLYDPGIHTGMILSLPGFIPTGQRVYALISSIDFAPTICDICGVTPLKQFLGVSFAPLLKESSVAQINEYIFAEKTYHDIYDPIRAVRSNTFKYIRNFESLTPVGTVSGDIKGSPSFNAWAKNVPNSPKHREELYDLKTDPLEWNNLAITNPSHPMLACLRGVLDKRLAETGDAILKGPYPAPTNASVDNAEAFLHLKGRKSRKG